MIQKEFLSSEVLVLENVFYPETGGPHLSGVAFIEGLPFVDIFAQSNIEFGLFDFTIGYRIALTRV